MTRQQTLWHPHASHHYGAAEALLCSRTTTRTEVLQRGDEQLFVAHHFGWVVVKAEQAVAARQRFLVQCRSNSANATVVGTDRTVRKRVPEFGALARVGPLLADRGIAAARHIQREVDGALQHTTLLSWCQTSHDCVVKGNCPALFFSFVLLKSFMP